MCLKPKCREEFCDCYGRSEASIRLQNALEVSQVLGGSTPSYVFASILEFARLAGYGG